MKKFLWLLVLIGVFGAAPDAFSACADPTARAGTPDVGLNFNPGAGVNAGVVDLNVTTALEGTLIYDPTLKRALLCDGDDWNIVGLGTQEYGATEITPAPSCKSILDAGASKGNGVYWLKPSASIAANQMYCDMENGGWTLIMAAGYLCPSSMLPASTALTSPTQCAYVPQNIVGALANFSTNVQLREGASPTTYTTATSTNALAISALKSPTGTWHNGSTFTGWDWSHTCAPTHSHGWPTMYQACGNGNGVHWGFSNDGTYVFDKISSRAAARTSAWLR